MSHGHDLDHVNDPGPLHVPEPLTRVFIVAFLAGAIIWGGSLFKLDPRSCWLAYLQGYIFFLDLALGAMLFNAINNVTSAQWPVVLRRIMEGLSRNYFLLSAVLFLGVLAGLPYTHVWARNPHMFHDSLKSFYLSTPGAVLTGLLFFGICGGLMHLLVSRSQAQDRAKDPGYVVRNRNTSILFVVCFGFFYSIFIVLTIMSLEPHWFSTMFGVYNFSGLLLSSISMVALVTLWVRGHARMENTITRRHLHDLGTWMVAFSVFMIYIGFSQYMLIWYANLPEETEYMIHRTQGGWGRIALGLVFLKWLTPWIVMMPQAFRTNPRVMGAVAVAVLCGQWLDLYWMIYPSNPAIFGTLPTTPFGWWCQIVPQFGALLFFGGLFFLSATTYLRKHSLLPMGDPRLLSSVNGWYV